MAGALGQRPLLHMGQTIEGRFAIASAAGGGFALNFSAWVEGRTRSEKPEAAPMLLPSAGGIRRTEHGGPMKRSIRPPSSVSPSSDS